MQCPVDFVGIVAVDLPTEDAVSLALPATAGTGWPSWVGVISAYPLFWQKNTIGSRHNEARLTASWNEPVPVAPSPKLATVT